MSNKRETFDKYDKDEVQCFIIKLDTLIKGLLGFIIDILRQGISEENSNDVHGFLWICSVIFQHKPMIYISTKEDDIIKLPLLYKGIVMGYRDTIATMPHTNKYVVIDEHFSSAPKHDNLINTVVAPLASKVYVLHGKQAQKKIKCDPWAYEDEITVTTSAFYYNRQKVFETTTEDVNYKSDQFNCRVPMKEMVKIEDGVIGIGNYRPLNRNTLIIPVCLFYEMNIEDVFFESNHVFSCEKKETN